jgi:hypothetical protein
MSILIKADCTIFQNFDTGESTAYRPKDIILNLGEDAYDIEDIISALKYCKENKIKYIDENPIIFDKKWLRYNTLEICIFYQSKGGIEFDSKNKFVSNSCEAMGMD